MLQAHDFSIHSVPVIVMTEENKDQGVLICKPTKWFLWRALAMIAMFGVFTVLFIKDGHTGYREKNYQFYMHESFKEVGASFDKMKAAGGVNESAWQKFVSEKKLSVPEDKLDTLPKTEGFDLKLPEALINGYDVFTGKGGEQGAVAIWRDFTGSKGWDSEPGKKAYDADSIRNQFISAGVAGALLLTVIFFLIRTMFRSIKADDKALYSQTGKTIPYTDMLRIDKRKWDNKGMAIVHYQENGEEKKVKIDGMVYGQFKEEDGAPAEKLFAHVLKNFKGEILDYETVEEESPAST